TLLRSPDGADDVYGVTVNVIGVEDSGGPLTVGALLDGDVEVADIYTSSPSIAEEDLVVLDDPEHLILPQNVVPVASAELDDKAVDIRSEEHTSELQSRFDLVCRLLLENK